MKKPATKTIEDAIALFSSERALAEATGYSQHAIWKARTGRLHDGISPKMALAIDKATKGKVSARELRPDLF
jgi:DNA-binding transcriptional regulator YdaS (Cro superfamily)